MLGLIAPRFIAFFLGDRFAASSSYVFWIALGFAFNSMYWMMANYLFYVRKTYIIAIITGLSSVLNIFLNYNFVGRFGAIGSAYAAAITFFVIFLATWIISARVYRMPWGLRLK